VTLQVATADGRTLRALRTRTAIVDALLDLMQEGELRPTAVQVANRARVSPRSIFQHFPDLEALFTAAAERYVERFPPALDGVSASGGLDERIDAFVSAWTARCEASEGMRRASLLQAHSSPAIRRRIASYSEHHRHEVERIFGRELDGRLDGDALATAIETATSWAVWDYMRRTVCLDEAHAAAIMRRLVRALLEPAT
jgi:TetR/AcrR family transcriptional regulator, regulator of autoinduction and epiphytic fitness